MSSKAVRAMMTRVEKKPRRWIVCRGCLERMDAERECLAYAETSENKSKFRKITVVKAPVRKRA